ncbi:MAG TPA: ATP-dependent RNA helicase HrpA [Pseudonocardiaceae bacterium]|nr:ATP-dependent RNA helicase HrpA [Pseudonocardiaceae bacterium]
MSSPLAELDERLPRLMPRDERRLRRRVDRARRIQDHDQQRTVAESIAAEVTAAEARVAARAASVPTITYPAELPVSQRKDDILAAIRDHQVVIVAGETGSGKTTQLPKICLEAGRGTRGMIGHTQPRRIAARAVAERIAEELGGELGDVVGYQVRFTGQVGERSLVKLMTDGILLAEIADDRQLHRYDTLIIDEAHERSLNIDFILGYLKRILPRRPDLTVIITSATIDPQRFSRHFADAPIVEVSGRTYPVEVRYRPVVDPDDPNADPDRDTTQAIGDAVRELGAAGPGDILVFCSGEREIRDTADSLNRLNLVNTEVVPLYARLSAAEQHRVFQPHTGRRIVLATNVAETSLTVPGIRYVIDPGAARISRYSTRLKVQRLPIEPVSQASANQRKGRCGRLSDGICVRLYSEADFIARPEFTEPEILRTNLASVILRMTSLGLGDLTAFPFLDPPDRRAIADGIALLRELGAIEASNSDSNTPRLTPIGRTLAQLPIDPRMARMVAEANNNGCLHEVMVIAAALSIQDPRERPSDRQQDADAKHARFSTPESDFLTFLRLWDYLREQQKSLSGNQFRKLCRAEYLNYLRVREWQDLYGQLNQMTKNLGMTRNDTPGDERRVHLSLLAGLLSHLGLKDSRTKPQQGRSSVEYQGARNARFAIFPGSALAKKPPPWVMAAELVETSRLWGRMVARVEPEWAERLAPQLVRRSYSEPHWDARRGAVLGMEKVSLYGLPIVPARTVNFGRVDPKLARELFIRHALVDGDWTTDHGFFQRNRELLAEVEELEQRARRRDILVHEDVLFDFYDQRIGPEVVSARHFDSWWKRVRATDPDLLTFDKSMLATETADELDPSSYPDSWPADEVALELSYQFEPGEADDGVTVRVPLAALHQVSAAQFSWQVPGLRAELVTALIRSLPKPLRRNFVPAPDVTRALLDRIKPGEESLTDALSRELRNLTGVDVPRDAWDLGKLPSHLRVTFRVLDDEGATVAESKDLGSLQRKLAERVREELDHAAADIARTGLRDWDFGELPRSQRRERHGVVVTGYPTLVDAGDSVAIRLVGSEAEQRRAMWAGTRRLVLLRLPSPVKMVTRALDNQAKLTLGRNPHGGVAALLDDAITAAADSLVTEAGGVAWDAAGFTRLVDAVRPQLGETVLDVLDLARQILAVAHTVEDKLGRSHGLPSSVDDVRGQLDSLVHKGFITETGRRRLADVLRYLRGIDRRLDKLAENPRRDQELTSRLADVLHAYRERRDQLGSEATAEIRWMIEELRISYFAQTLGTAYPISDKRVYRAIDQLAD